MNVIIPTPLDDSDHIADKLRTLTRTLIEHGHGTPSGGLGGRYGYGTAYTNSTFNMHPYCWCGADTCDWCIGCSCPDDSYEYTIDGTTVDVDTWFDTGGDHGPGDRQLDRNTDLICDWCRGGAVSAPNFEHHPTGTRVWWYKYIGRSMEQHAEQPTDWDTILDDCLRSITTNDTTNHNAVHPPAYT